MISRRFRSSKTFTTFVVCVSIFTDILLQNLVVPVLPFALSEQVGLSDEEDIQRWNSILLSSFGGALMVGSLVLGYIGDKMPGRVTPFVYSWLVLAASTVCFAFGSSLPVLLMARILEGFSTAVVLTLGYALLNDVVGTEHLGKAMGYTSIAFSSGLLLGPVIGGVLYKYGGYFTVFVPAFGLLVVEIILRLLIIERKAASRVLFRNPKPAGNHLPEHQDTGEREEIIENGRMEDASRGKTDTQPLLPKPASSQSKHAFLILLASPRFLIALTGILTVNCIGCGFDGVLGPYIKDTFDMQATHAAALFLALAIPMFLAPLPGILTDRYGAKLPAAVGFALAAPSLTLLGLVSRGADWPFIKLLALLAFVGTSFAFALPPLRVEASKVVDAIERDRPGVFGARGAYSQAYGLINTVGAAGVLIGPVYAGFARVWLGWEAMSLSMGILSLSMLILVVLVTGGRSEIREMTKTRHEEEQEEGH